MSAQWHLFWGSHGWNYLVAFDPISTLNLAATLFECVVDVIGWGLWSVGGFSADPVEYLQGTSRVTGELLQGNFLATVRALLAGG